ncbi:hypothetical protein [Desulfocurvibacter africanus]|uniref:hypothetical protein n=1 Tax=Desulfocurvibacter africanus TaxID=873 RepID=UPI000401F34A|nr:hypothetical protein [Desulfocurvibacter africanus]
MPLPFLVRNQDKLILEHTARRHADAASAQTIPASPKSRGYRRDIANNLVDALAVAGWPWNRRLSLYLDSLEAEE